MNQLYLQVTKADKENQYLFSLESFISLFIYKTVDEPENIELNLINNPKTKSIWVNVNLENSKYKFYDESSCPILANSCSLPLLITDNNTTIISGLCGVCRGILKNLLKYRTHEFSTDLLGFKSACLLAPTETSIWTKFCEIDIISAVNLIKKQFNEREILGEFFLSEEFSRFECHMSQPIRIHNVYKLARNLVNNKDNINKINKELEKITIDEQQQLIKNPRMNKKRKSKLGKNSIQISSNIPVQDLNIEHKFVEGHKITLADAILFTCMHLIFDEIPVNKSLCEIIPLTMKWFNIMKEYDNGNMNIVYNKTRINKQESHTNNIEILYNMKILENYSLYKSDPKRYKPKNRIFTRQEDVEIALNKITESKIKISSETKISPGREINFTWDDVPFDALPEGGNLPIDRLNRKKEQLENLAREVIALAKYGDTIVDFCSGTGHLGILLACKLPNCRIILLENKEESLNIAKNRATILKLNNLLFFQCNLDYFSSNFKIGTSLHACGTVTDIVLKHCINNNANFVCCPCCYGGIHKMPHINYPRSKIYKNININYNDYIFIAHCADQTHNIFTTKCNIDKSIQGELCMDIIDTDRSLQAKEFGYNIILTRLIPEKCTPKNRLIIGFK